VPIKILSALTSQPLCPTHHTARPLLCARISSTSLSSIGSLGGMNEDNIYPVDSINELLIIFRRLIFILVVF
jgi:hypothetical protein